MSRVLTNRERQVIEHAMAGLTAEESGRALGVATNTVRVHRRNILGKLHARSMAQAVAIHLDHISTIVTEVSA